MIPEEIIEHEILPFLPFEDLYKIRREYPKVFENRLVEMCTNTNVHEFVIQQDDGEVFEKLLTLSKDKREFFPLEYIIPISATSGENIWVIGTFCRCLEVWFFHPTSTIIERTMELQEFCHIFELLTEAIVSSCPQISSLGIIWE